MIENIEGGAKGLRISTGGQLWTTDGQPAGTAGKHSMASTLGRSVIAVPPRNTPSFDDRADVRGSRAEHETKFPSRESLSYEVRHHAVNSDGREDERLHLSPCFLKGFAVNHRCSDRSDRSTAAPMYRSKNRQKQDAAHQNRDKRGS